MTPQERKLLDTALLAAHATHRYWLATHAICEAIFAGDVKEIGRQRKMNTNIEGYGTQSKELSALAVELADALTEG